MLKFLIILLVIVFSKFLERCERKNSRVFWPICFMALTVSFSLFDGVSFQKNQNSKIFENNIVSVLARGGGEEDRPRYFVPPNLSTGKDDIDRSGRPEKDPPKYPWGADPSYRTPLGGSSGGNSGSDNVEEENRVADQSEWINDESIWNSVQQSDSSVSQEEENKSPGKLKSDIDFQYQYDSNGNPTLLIPNTGRLRKKRTYTKVEFDQTAVHMHHAPDFGIALPANFDMNKYLSLDRAGRLDYANKNLPRETIINYQNEIGKSLCSIFNIGGKTLSVPGFAGKQKIGTELTIERKPDGRNMLGIIREDGTHISSYSLELPELEKLIKNDFWVLRYRNL